MSTFRVVKLLKNHLYPTYQLHAFMSNEKTAPQDGLRLAALTTMDWLRKRLGEDVPEAWSAIFAPEDYLTASNADLPSLYVNQGHVINVVSLPEKGMWTLQITEPDLGSDPGNPEQARSAVPGRIIETNIAFKVVGKQVECGFKTVISDPIGTSPEAEVYRLAVVRELMKNPAFGLKQVIDFRMDATRLSTSSQIKTMLYVTHHEGNQLPTVIFTQTVEEKKTAPATIVPETMPIGRRLKLSPLDLKSYGLPMEGQIPTVAKTELVAADPPFDLEQFCYYSFSHCRTYIMDYPANKSFGTQTGITFNPGDVLVLYPTALGGGEEVIPFMPSASRQREMIDTILEGVKSYMKARAIDYGGIEFLSEARTHLLRMTEEMSEDAEAADARFQQQLEQVNAYWKNELESKNVELEDLKSQLQRQKEYAARLENEKSKIREDFSIEWDKLRGDIDKHQETIEFLRRRYDQPADYDRIPAWVEEHFNGRLILHPKAIARLGTKAAQCAAVELICDALDYLATDYWAQRYQQMPREIALTRCSEKYGRPFEVKPVGAYTIAYTPTDYRIPYFRDERGRIADSDLDYHLCVGNDPENLLRIYFLHDDDQQLIVVGSLPDHLRAVKIH